MEGEEWRDIPGYEGFYKVSNYGRVKRLPRHVITDKRKTHNNIRVLKKTTRGYYCVNLSKENKTRWVFVHRIVAQVFIENPNNFPIINHKDENPQNNCVVNLEWCSYKYNCNYGTARQRQKESRANNPNDKNVRKLVGKKNSKPINQFTPDGIYVATYPSLMAASEATGVNISNIIRHCKGRVGNDMNRPIRKFRFEYANEIQQRESA